ncbi:MAG: HAD family hydrolase [Bdellovibrionales bacterium]
MPRMKTLRKPRAIVWDLDGTLLDTIPLINVCHNVVASAFGRPQRSVTESKNLTALAPEVIMAELAGAENVAAARELYVQEYAAKHLEYLATCDGAGDMLAAIHAAGIVQSINTSKRRSFMEPEIAQLGWGAYFKVTVCPGEAPKNKPDPASFVHCCMLMGIEPGVDVWMIGDTAADVDCGIGGGGSTVLVSADVYEGKEPTLQCRDLRELAAVFANLKD